MDEEAEKTPEEILERVIKNGSSKTRELDAYSKAHPEIVSLLREDVDFFNFSINTALDDSTKTVLLITGDVVKIAPLISMVWIAGYRKGYEQAELVRIQKDSKL